jgi:hypothetical protein
MNDILTENLSTGDVWANLDAICRIGMECQECNDKWNVNVTNSILAQDLFSHQYGLGISE